MASRQSRFERSFKILNENIKARPAEFKLTCVAKRSIHFVNQGLLAANPLGSISDGVAETFEMVQLKVVPRHLYYYRGLKVIFEVTGFSGKGYVKFKNAYDKGQTGVIVGTVSSFMSDISGWQTYMDQTLGKPYLMVKKNMREFLETGSVLLYDYDEPKVEEKPKPKPEIIELGEHYGAW